MLRADNVTPLLYPRKIHTQKMMSSCSKRGMDSSDIRDDFTTYEDNLHEIYATHVMRTIFMKKSTLPHRKQTRSTKHTIAMTYFLDMCEISDDPVISEYHENIHIFDTYMVHEFDLNEDIPLDKLLSSEIAFGGVDQDSMPGPGGFCFGSVFGSKSHAGKSKQPR